MNRNILLTLNAVFLAFSLWLLVARLILPFIQAAQAIGFSDALSLLSGVRPVLLLIAPCLFTWMMANIVKLRWSLVLYVSSYVLLILAVILLASGVVSVTQGEDINVGLVITLVAALLLLATAWFNGRALKGFNKPVA
ncbi:hypothetical protein [Saccharospirillum salsuginis]|uniref:Uncharacterized protein n=1 Tax=Saccharospirillum salsuginis TaxID=418750 RepID=A0A918KNE7_9GAMM|nr:hypothetical protein [Saccharospirillum salsuginis]GGX68954.1 hypothetical protein GCM10007392_40780 [Saccharospirillum salsuginis]